MHRGLWVKNTKGINIDESLNAFPYVNVNASKNICPLHLAFQKDTVLFYKHLFHPVYLGHYPSFHKFGCKCLNMYCTGLHILALNK